jgi:hypothetical protein
MERGSNRGKGFAGFMRGRITSIKKAARWSGFSKAPGA